MTKKQMRKIRKVVKNITLIMIIIVMFFWYSWYETHYTREAIVINATNNIVTVIDACNYTWSFYGDGFDVNDKVKLTMDTMNTNFNVFDDVIKDVKVINKNY